MDSISVSDALSTFVGGVGNSDGDPFFVDSLGTDFHLSKGSHCIAAGIDSLEVDSVWQGVPLTDIERLPRPRPLGTRPDMGAFEEQLTNPVGVAPKSRGDVLPVFRLEQKYPNPFNPGTLIRYSIPESREYAVGSMETKLVVFDILGREVAVLVNKRKAPGNYEVKFDASGLSTGVYVY